MRIGFITRKFPPTLSGMSTYAFNLCTHLVSAGVDLTVFAQFRPDALGSSGYGDGHPDELPGARVIGLPQRHEVERGAFEDDIAEIVANVVSENDRRPFDILHAQYGYPCGAAAVLAARLLNRPAVVSLQGGDGHWFGSCCEQHMQTLTWLLRHSSVILCPTESFRGRVEHRTAMSFVSTVLPGAVDTKRFRRNESARGAWRARLDIADDVKAVVFHGRLDNRKGVRELLESFATLESPTRTVLLVAGIGPDALSLKAMAEVCIAPERLRWLGHLPYAETPELLSSADIYCSPTYQEGFSNTLIEAAACELPIVTTDTVGVRDVFRDGETALLAPIEDAAAIRKRLAILLVDPYLCSRVARTAYDLVESSYSWEALVKRILDVYSQAPALSQATTPLPPERMGTPCPFRENPLLL